jgi:integrase
MEAANFSLYKLDRYDRWYIQYVDEDGNRKQKSTRCTRRSDALKKLTNFKKFIAKEPKKPTILLSTFIADYLKHIEAVHPKTTMRSYELSLRVFKRIIGDVPLGTITPKHWDAYKTTRLHEKKHLQGHFPTEDEKTIALQAQSTISVGSVNIELRSILAAMNTAVRWELIPKNPFVNQSLVTVPKRTPAYLTAPDAERLLEAIKEDWFRDIVIFAINTGMRRGELLSLRWQDIDTETRLARITNRVDFTTKSGEQRIVSLNDAALSVLDRRRLRSKCDAVFTDDRGRILTPDTVSHKFKRTVRAVNLPDALHLHSLRHSFASLLVGSGTSIFTVSQLLGHSSVKTSQIYAHLLPQHLHSEVRKIDIGNSYTEKKL